MSRKVDEGSMVDVKIDKIWPRASAKLSSAFYTPDGTEDPHKYAWGDEHPNFHGLPPTYVGVAEQDVLRDGALTVAMRMLKENKCAGLEIGLLPW
jgi:acetyl esterase/lipase